MSSILKALEKVDESQRSRRPAGTGGLPRGRGRRAAWVIPVWALGGAAVAALATYALMGGFSKPAAQVAQKGAEVTAATPVAAPARPLPAPPVAPAAQAEPARKEAVARVQPVAEVAKPAPAGTAAKQAALPVAKPVTRAAAKATVKAVLPQQPAGKASARPLAQPVAKAAMYPAAAPQPAPAQPVQMLRPEIRVTGIAWQNNSESSFAMVNGKPMRQGNVIDGYKIEQIYEDSVRFSSSKGNSLVVPLGAGED